MRRSLILSLLVCTILGACGAPSDIAGSSPGGGSQPSSGSGTAPDTPVTGGGGAAPGGKAKPERVEPRPGMAGVMPLAWEKVKARGPRALDVFFWSGVEPCYVLDRVEVKETPGKVEITLFQGHDPQDEDTACIEIAVRKVVRVKLDSPLDGRDVVDGA